MDLNPEHGRRLIQLARDSIAHGLREGCPLPTAPADYAPPLRRKLAAFVTLNTHGALRGCIGSLQARRPLVADISENAYAAAFEDPRFEPLTAAELEDIDIHISVLAPPRQITFRDEADLIDQLRPNIDGVILADQEKSATFLPSVWRHYPAPAQFLRELKRKAGMDQDHWSDTIKASRYTTRQFGARGG